MFCSLDYQLVLHSTFPSLHFVYIIFFSRNEVRWLLIDSLFSFFLSSSSWWDLHTETCIQTNLTSAQLSSDGIRSTHSTLKVFINMPTKISNESFSFLMMKSFEFNYITFNININISININCYNLCYNFHV